MSEFKGTKGKWKIVFTEEVESYLDIAISSEKDDCVAWVYRSSEYKSLNGQANALLISKSPLLLKAIKDSINELREVGLNDMANYHEKLYNECVNL